MTVVGLLVAACGTGGTSHIPSVSAAGSPRPSPPPDFAFGAWTMTLDEADWVAAGFEPSALLDQNTGVFVIDFARDGTWRSVQTSLIGVHLIEPVFSGTYTVSGDTLRLETDFPEHYKAEGVYIDVIRWRLDGDELHLDLIDLGDEFTAVIYGTHVWIRR
jgi:hypothetical protein